MRALRPRRWPLAACVCAHLVSANVARGERGALTETEAERLAQGETVVRPASFDAGQARWIGGVTYTVFDVHCDRIRAELRDPAAYARLLPRVKSARLVGENDGDRFIEIRHSMLDAVYTIRMREDSPSSFRFWLDRGRPHDLDDAWGFTRLAELTGEGGAPRCFVTYAILASLGESQVATLFEGRIRRAMLSLPALLRRRLAVAPPKVPG
jgi:hypothetical protein